MQQFGEADEPGGSSAAGSQPPPIILVHGAFHGGWCWKHVARLLRARGHDVFTPTQTGLGERRHLLTAVTGMDTFVEDILNLVDCEELRDVVLVGHSFGARTICGVADRVPHLVRCLIYIDGGLPIGNVSRLDAMPHDQREARIRSAIEFDGGLSVPPPPAVRFGVTDPALAAWLESHLTPQPLAAERSALSLRQPIGAGRSATFIRCIRPPFPGTEASAAFARDMPGWRYLEVQADHNVIVTQPQLTADMISDEIAHRG